MPAVREEPGVGVPEFFQRSVERVQWAGGPAGLGDSPERRGARTEDNQPFGIPASAVGIHHITECLRGSTGDGHLLQAGGVKEGQVMAVGGPKRSTRAFRCLLYTSRCV